MRALPFSMLISNSMKLQHKAWALVLTVVALCTAAAMLAARHVVSSSFDRLETERVQREGERARRVLNQEVQSLLAVAQDNAYWIDAFEFVQGRNPTFFYDNFSAESLGNLRATQVLGHDASGRVIGSAERPEEGSDLRPVSLQTQQALQALVEPLIASGDPKKVLRTFQVANGKLEMVSVALVHDPDRPELGAKGALTMVRHLDAAEIQRFADVLMIPTSLSFDLRGVEDMQLEVVDAQRQDLRTKLLDHLGRPVAELVMQLDRNLHRQGQWLAWTSMGLSGLAGLAAAFLLVSLLDRLLLRRLQGLHSDVHGIVLNGPLKAAPVTVGEPDELGQLAKGINDLLARVRQDAQNQREAHEQQEALQIQLMQSQKTQALGRLTGGIAHDFNNSLAAISGSVRLAAEDLPDPEHPSHEALQQILKATRYASGLTRQLLAFGRQATPRFRPMQLSELIEETRQLVSVGLTKECEVVFDDLTDGDVVDADPTQLQQVLVNLLINAADAMNGQGRIELTLERQDLPLAKGQDAPPGAEGLPDGRYLTLRVQDHGPGVSPELVDSIFDPFFTTKVSGGGNGLGLSVAQGIMSRHFGSIGLINGPYGACFVLYLPSRQAV